MFFHNFKYALKTTLKNKTTLIWTLIFPIALATFMYMAFGSLFEEEMFEAISVAVVVEEENKNFEEVLEGLATEGEDQIIKASYTSGEEAKKLLEDEEIEAIIYVGKEPYLTVKENSYEATILQTVLEEFEKANKVVTQIGKDNPLKIPEAIANVTKEAKYFTAKTTSDGNQDVYTNYFYAIFAMSCLFSSFIATNKIHSLQADKSALGMRRCLSPNSKMVTVVAEFLAMLLVQFTIEVITLVYMTILGVDFGVHYGLILIILFFGSCIGISMGILFGVLSKSKGAAEGICTAVSMFLSVLSDLCANGIKYAIEQKAPIINRLNPAALISDSFYALNVYDTYDRYIRNIVTLGCMSVILVTVSILILRRNKYASV